MTPAIITIQVIISTIRIIHQIAGECFSTLLSITFSLIKTPLYNYAIIEWGHDKLAEREGFELS
jgi:hypothetical protein